MGTVSSQLNQQTGNAVQEAVGGAVGVPIDNDKFGTMLAAGKDEFRRFLRDNAGDFDGILRSGRTGG